MKSNGSKFEYKFMASSGIPQGYLTINELPNLLSYSQCRGFLYANDTKLYSTILTTEDSVNLQSDLNCIANWLLSSNLTINSSKYSYISYSIRDPHVSTSTGRKNCNDDSKVSICYKKLVLKFLAESINI